MSFPVLCLSNSHLKAAKHANVGGKNLVKIDNVNEGLGWLFQEGHFPSQASTSYRD